MLSGVDHFALKTFATQPKLLTPSFAKLLAIRALQVICVYPLSHHLAVSVQTVNGKAWLLQGAVWKYGVLKPGSKGS